MSITQDNNFGKNILCAMFDFVPVGMAAVTSDGTLQAVNNAFCRISGYTHEELIGMKFNSVIHSEYSKEIFPAELSEELSGEFTSEQLYIRKNGSSVWISLKITLIRNEQGKPDYFVVAVDDITALKSIEARFKGFLDSAPDAMIIVDMEGKIIQTNLQTEKLFGYSDKELFGKTIEFLMPERFRDRHRQLRAEFSKKPHTRDMNSGWVLHALRKDGNEFPAEISLSYHKIEDEIVVLSAVRDISERVRMEKALKESEAKYRDLIETTATGYVIMGEQGHVLDANTEYLRLSGYTQLNDIVDRSPAEWTSPQDRERNEKEIIKCLELGSVRNLEIDYINRQGQITPIEINAKLIDTSEGKRIIGLCRDNTIRKRNERALRESEERLSVVFNNTSDMQLLVSVDDDGEFRIAEINRSYLETTKQYGFYYSPERVIGMTLHKFGREVFQFDGSIIEKVYVNYRRAVAAKEPIYYEETVTVAAGVFHAEVTVVPVLDENKKCRYLLWSSRNITQRKQIESSLRESEERTRAIIDSALDAVVTINSEGILTSWNRQAEIIFGWKESEIIGRSMSEMIIPASLRADHLKALKNYLSKGDSDLINNRFEMPAIRRDGTEFPVELTVAPIRLNGAIYFSAFIRDLSEKKRSEATLNDTANRLKLAVKAGNVGLWSWDLLTNEVYFSPEWKAQIGYMDDELKNDYSEWEKRLHPDDLASTQASLQAALAPPWPVHRVEFRLRHKNGTYRWILAHGSLEFDTGGKPIRVWGSHVDVTDRKEAEASLKESDQRQQLVIEGIGAGVWEFSPLKNQGYLSTKYCEMLGYQPGEIKATYQQWFERIHPEDREKVKTSLQHHLSYREPFDLEFRMKTKRGNYLWFQANGKALWNDEGQAILMSGSIADITNRKQMEQALNASEERLRQAVRVGSFGIFDHDQVVDEIYWSPELRNIFGVGDEPATLKKFIELTHPDDRDTMAIAIQRAHDPEGSGLFDIEFRLIRPDGALRWLTAQSQTFFDGEGNKRRPSRTIGAIMDMTIRKDSEDRLKKSLQDKEILLKEIHHRVKNNLQVISSLLHLQSIKSPDQAAQELFRESHNRISSIALVHEKLYQSDNYSRINFYEYTRSLVTSLFQSFGTDGERIALNLNFDDTDLAIDKAIPCGLILNEAVSNSLKYAFPDMRSGCVTIKLKRLSENRCSLTISDTGIGLFQDFDPTKSASLGVRLIYRLSEQINGNVTLKTDGGISYEIVFEL